MDSTLPDETSGSSRGKPFEPTLWSVVFDAKQADSPEGISALEQLCHAYWYPIYAFLRRWGYGRETAKDLTQGFFAHLVSKDLVKEALPEKGRFRSFLLGALKNFARNERRREAAGKRGGGVATLSLDDELAEGRYTLESKEDTSPERLFDRRWASEVLRQALHRLRDDYQRASKATEFAALQSCITTDQDVRYKELAATLEKKETAVRAAVSRLRHQFRETVRRIVADTLVNRDEVEDELRHLQSILRGE